MQADARRGVSRGGGKFEREGRRIIATLRQRPPVDPRLLARMVRQEAEAEVAAGDVTEPALAPAEAARFCFLSSDAEGYVPRMRMWQEGRRAGCLSKRRKDRTPEGRAELVKA